MLSGTGSVFAVFGSLAGPIVFSGVSFLCQLSCLYLSLRPITTRPGNSLVRDLLASPVTNAEWYDALNGLYRLLLFSTLAIVLVPMPLYFTSTILNYPHSPKGLFIVAMFLGVFDSIASIRYIYWKYAATGSLISPVILYGVTQVIGAILVKGIEYFLLPITSNLPSGLNQAIANSHLFISLIISLVFYSAGGMLRERCYSSYVKLTAARLSS